MAASASSQLGLVLLFSVGTLLLLTMAPQFGTALECNYVMPKSAAVGPRPAVEWTKMMNLAKISQAFGMPTNGDSSTIQCPGANSYCISLHCRKVYGNKKVKSCAELPGWAKTPAEVCNFIRPQCGDDPKFYCRYCQTDKCNDE